MPVSGKFLEHSGPVNYETIDRLLINLKNSEDFLKLPKTTGKRVYAILVEILENITKHSAIEPAGHSKSGTFLSAEESDDKIIIKGRNHVTAEKKERLDAILELVNHLDEDALTTLYEENINRKSKLNGNGAGLGFIIIRLICESPIQFSFHELVANSFLFEIQITVNKYIMRKLLIEKTANSPGVTLDPGNNIFEISGESRPPDVASFYKEILSWFDEFSRYLRKSQQGINPHVFTLDFEYFNSSSAKYILDLCKLIATARTKELNVSVNWLYEKDDIDMLEAGKEMSRISKLSFEFIQKDI